MVHATKTYNSSQCCMYMYQSPARLLLDTAIVVHVVSGVASFITTDEQLP